MEVLVALALFSVVVTIATDLFISFQHAGRKTEGLENAVVAARFIMERVARETREGTVDFAAYPATPVSGVQQTLYLRSSTDEPISFSFIDNTVFLELDGSSEALTGGDIRVRDARFFINPDEDPFNFDTETGAFDADDQPRVAVFLSLDNGYEEGNSNYVRYDVQTTISARAYRR